jgi:DNA invertase Pin-like site-specific DNA recombinase
VGLGKVGIVLMLEASRLARNNSDWYRLIEICGLTATLIGDESAIYNPREPNDRLLLGVKGTLSEAELFTLRTRLYEGRWNKARKGLLQFPLPTGYVRGAGGSWELDPDAQVRERLNYLFESFRRHGVARSVALDLKREGLDLPVRGCESPRSAWVFSKSTSHILLDSSQPSLRGSVRVWPLGVLGRTPFGQDG